MFIGQEVRVVGIEVDGSLHLEFARDGSNFNLHVEDAVLGAAASSPARCKLFLFY